MLNALDAQCFRKQEEYSFLLVILAWEGVWRRILTNNVLMMEGWLITNKFCINTKSADYIHMHCDRA